MDNTENEPLSYQTNELTGHIPDSDVSALYKPNGTKLTKRNSQENKEETTNSDLERWTLLLVLASATCCLGSALPAGYNIGVMGNAANIMKNFCNQSMEERYGITVTENGLELLWSTIVSIFLIGGVTGSLTASYLANRIGRRGALAIGNICGIIGSILFLLIPSLNSIELFLLGRVFVGLSGGLATSLLPTYMTEVAPIKLRGAVGVLCQLGITCGVLLGQIAGLDSVLGTKDHWQCMLAAYAPLCIIALILIFILPESPKYLFVVREEQEAAVKALSKFRNIDRILLHNEIAGLEVELAAKSTNSSWTITRLFREPTLKLPLMLVSFLQLGQQLSGINAVFYYSNVIFKSAGLDVKTSQYATIGTGIINVVMALISVPLMSHFGRRTLFLTSSFAAIACLSVLTCSIALINIAFMQWICIMAVLAFVLAYGIGLGPIPYFIGSELFDVGPRSAAMSVGSMCNWGGNFIVGMTFTQMQKFLGSFSFLFFILCILGLALFCRKFLPETRGRTTTDIAASVSHGLASRPNEGSFSTINAA